MFNTYGTSKNFVDKALIENKHVLEKALGSRDEWEIYTVEAQSGTGLDCIYNALSIKICGSDLALFNKAELSLRQDITDIQFIAGSWFYRHEAYITSRRSVIEKRRGNKEGSFVKCNFRGVGMVFFEVWIISSMEGPIVSNYVVINRKDADKLKKELNAIVSSFEYKYTIMTYDCDGSGQIRVDQTTGLEQSWDNLVLNQEVLNLVKKDTESFIARKAWFIKNDLPFRRGYLFHGPPGNGKTSVIKTLLSNLDMNAYKIRLFSKTVSDAVLEMMFKDAQRSGPNVVVLEDLDRAFPKTGETRSTLGMHTLLNCLDGLASQEGVITIATANEPTILDKAILKRPGRFDRVVLFDNPDVETRLKYYLKKAPYLSSKELEPVADTTIGFSFAQLQETYILAGQLAFERNEEEVTAGDLHNCAGLLRGSTNSVGVGSDKRGF
jgi:SpoVK/Ycf46/Vps4 family AAA+-type ATPase